MRRHELSDEQWELIKPLISVSKSTTGRPARDARTLLHGMLWVLRTGAPWRDLPERFGPWQTVYHYFSHWRSGGLFDRIIDALQIRLDGEGKIDWDLWCVDGSSVRATRAAGGASKKVAAVTPTSRKTTLWAVREADSAASCTWLLTAREFPRPSKSAPAKPTRRSMSNRS